ncbi:MAG: hypothetical protein ACREP6_02725, partial [Candidatus Binataceae bacterium]
QIVGNDDGLLGGIRLWDEGGTAGGNAQAARADKSISAKPMRRKLSQDGKKSAISPKPAVTQKNAGNHKPAAAEIAPASAEPPG